jgi:hypothetical protein
MTHWSGKNIKLEAMLFIFMIIFLPIHLSAQDEIPDSLVNERIQCIQDHLNQGRTTANLWWYGWLGAYSAATIGQGAVYFLSNDKGTRQDMALGASTTLLGAAGQLVMPINPGRKADILAQIPDSTPGERLNKLIYAEKMFKEIAKNEKFGRSWKMHVIYGAVNISSGLITWLGFKRSIWAGLGNFALNTVISEAQIWTQPTRTMKDYQDYCRKYKSGINPLSYKPKPAFYVGACPDGIAIKMVF